MRNRIKILLVSGSFPPIKCGVGDYTYIVASQLAAMPELEIGVLTSAGTNDCHGIQVYKNGGSWRWRDLSHILAAVRQFSPDIIHIQYPTAGYGRHKMPVFLPCILRNSGFSIVQTWHEVIRGARCLRYLPAAICQDAITVIEPDYEFQTPDWFWKLATRQHLKRISIGSNIPAAELTSSEREQLRQKLSGGQERLLSYFGFAAPPKAVEILFSIADPKRDHLLLVCELNPEDSYHSTLLEIAQSPQWRGKVTITGYQGHQRVAELLAAADAAIFPFRDGATRRNASIMAAAMQGTFVVTTSTSRSGYIPGEHASFVAPGDIEGIRTALEAHSGERAATPSLLAGDWKLVAADHLRLYQEILRKKSTC